MGAGLDGSCRTNPLARVLRRTGWGGAIGGPAWAGTGRVLPKQEV